MKRTTLFVAAIVMALGIGAAGTDSAYAQTPRQGPVSDDSLYHPQLLPRGTLEYQFALERQQRALRQGQFVDSDRLSAALKACEQIQPLAQAQRDKCEIRAHQTAAKPAAAGPAIPEKAH